MLINERAEIRRQRLAKYVAAIYINEAEIMAYLYNAMLVKYYNLN